MTIAQKLVFVFEWKGAVHSNRRGCQLIQPLEGKVVVYGKLWPASPFPVAGLPTPFSCLPLVPPSLRIYVPSRSEWAIHPLSVCYQNLQVVFEAWSNGRLSQSRNATVWHGLSTDSLYSWLPWIRRGWGRLFQVFFLGYHITIHGYCLQLVHDHFLSQLFNFSSILILLTFNAA
jgi:hypothetical protein